MLTVDDINPALPAIRNIPSFPLFRVLQVMLRIYIISTRSDVSALRVQLSTLRGAKVSLYIA